MSTTLVANPERSGPLGTALNMPRAFRLRRAPVLEPPFDDEREIGDPSSSMITLRPAIARLDSDHEATVGAPPSSAPSSAAAHAASRYVQVCLEVLNGFRPPSHLRTLAGPIEFADVLRHLRLPRNGGSRSDGSRADGSRADGSSSASVSQNSAAGRHGPAANQPEFGDGARLAVHGERPMTAPPNRTHGRPAFRLLRLRVSEPVPDKAEVVAVIAHADVSIAIAMRLELHRASWVCTVFQVV
jgi:Family of unknown function (DUF6459)